MTKLVLFLMLVVIAVWAAAAAPIAKNSYDTGRYDPYYNSPIYIRQYYRNRDYYNNRRYYDNFFKQYNPSVSAQQARIVEQSSVPIRDGRYAYSYETENGIHGEERGVAVSADNEDQAEEVVGSYSFITPEGMRVGVRYTADKNGFHPVITYDGINAEKYARLQQPADVSITRIL